MDGEWAPFIKGAQEIAVRLRPFVPGHCVRAGEENIYEARLRGMSGIASRYSEALRSAGIFRGRRQSRAEVRPACIHPYLVSSDPITPHAAAARRNFDDRSRPETAANRRSASAPGPDTTPPTRVIAPLNPDFNGWSSASLRVSTCRPSQLSHNALPMPRMLSARLSLCPINSSNDTPACTPEAPKWIGSV